MYLLWISIVNTLGWLPLLLFQKSACLTVFGMSIIPYVRIYVCGSCSEQVSWNFLINALKFYTVSSPVGASFLPGEHKKWRPVKKQM